ncbi:uncharacterized protein COL4A2-AS2 [Trachypithecus francoisi]|uniref:uncharacterized protein COL4A2-AS2 n=1 Tax=Trachypithecus francoisi TaxID=54180 RepID=UPI00141B0210|nr:uncharacterized protein COL4A2-AS2 [Trachypithecus francoisi]
MSKSPSLWHFVTSAPENQYKELKELNPGSQAAREYYAGSRGWPPQSRDGAQWGGPASSRSWGACYQVMPIHSGLLNAPHIPHMPKRPWRVQDSASASVLLGSVITMGTGGWEGHAGSFSSPNTPNRKPRETTTDAGHQPHGCLGSHTDAGHRHHRCLASHPVVGHQHQGQPGSPPDTGHGHHRDAWRPIQPKAFSQASPNDP